jgi:1-acyl-sn-glycerol-3-phosphate acyltransferase
MFAYLLIIIHFIVMGLGIYLFDYQADQVINSPLVIILSLISGLLAMLIVFYLYIEVFYYLFGKNDSPTSKRKHFFAKHIMIVPLFGLNMKVKVKGYENLPKETGFSIYANHTSMMDIPILMYYLKKHPVAFLAKKEAGEIFSVGKWIPALGGVLVDRSSARQGAESILKVIKNIKNGSTMVIFPEGTREKKLNTILDFKAGSFKAALKSKKPLVPVTLVKSEKRPWPRRKNVTMVIHQAIPYDDFKDLTSNDLADKVKAIINEPLLKA